MAGIQFYLEMIDNDIRRPIDDLIDRIVVDLDPVPTFSTSIHRNVTGVYRLGHMNLTFDVNCKRNFSGEFCVTQSNSSQNQTVEEDGGVDVARIVSPIVVFTVIIAVFVALVSAVLCLVVKLRRAKQHSASSTRHSNTVCAHTYYIIPVLSWKPHAQGLRTVLNCVCQSVCMSSFTSVKINLALKIEQLSRKIAIMETLRDDMPPSA